MFQGPQNGANLLIVQEILTAEEGIYAMELLIVYEPR
jgi:hypothetical protein